MTDGSSPGFALLGPWSCHPARLGPLEPSLVDEPVDEVVLEEPAPAEPLARDLALGCEDRGLHRRDDELLDPAVCFGRLGICVVVAKQLTRVRVAAVR